MRKSSEERKAEVLQESLRILHEEGVHALTLRSIASAVGISEAALFRHFRNKEEIMEQLADTIFESTYTPRAEGLEELMTSRLERFERQPMRTALLFQEEVFRAYPNIKARFDEHRRRTQLRMAAAVEEGKRSGDLCSTVDGEAMALIIMGTIRMLVLEWRSDGYVHSLAERAGPVIDQLMAFARGE
jgi:AcrR family transcriptional regulator